MAYETTTELRTFLGQEVGDVSPSSDTLARYLNLLDMAHKAILSGGRELNLDDRNTPLRRPVIFPWALALRPKLLILEPKQETTATVTNNNASATIGIDSATKSLVGWHCRINDTSTVYYVSAHSGTTVTLDSVYVDDSITTADAVFFKLIYTVGSDVLLPADKARTFKDPYEISMVSRNTLSDKYPLSKVGEAIPKLIGVLKQEDGTLTLQLSSYPDELTRIELPYVPVPSDLSTSGSNPLIPKHHRTALVHLAAFYHLRKRDDDRATSHLKTAKQLFDALVVETAQIQNANDEDFGLVEPWQGGFDGGIL